jgi:hypothetical protein
VLEKEWARHQLCHLRHDLSEFASTIREGIFTSEIERVLEFLQDGCSDRFEEVFSRLSELEILEWDYRMADLKHFEADGVLAFNYGELGNYYIYLNLPPLSYSDYLLLVSPKLYPFHWGTRSGTTPHKYAVNHTHAGLICISPYPTLPYELLEWETTRKFPPYVWRPELDGR